MTIEPNKFYRIRSGKKARIYAIDGAGERPVHGAYEDLCGWYVNNWSEHGVFANGMESDLDLIADWVDAPEVDWPAMPIWVSHLAKDSNGAWFGYDTKPSRENRSWSTPEYKGYRIDPSYFPKFSGDWKDSLVERPNPKTV